MIAQRLPRTHEWLALDTAVLSGLGQVPAQTHLFHDSHSLSPARSTARAIQSLWEEGTLSHHILRFTGINPHRQSSLKEQKASYQWKDRLREVTQLALDHSVSSREFLGGLHFTHSEPCH